MNPYKIEGPSIIAFSGGRTSAFMLYHILEAHNGVLPDDVVVVFNNTGKERAETLRFVHECERRWNVVVHWTEWREGGFEQVGFNSASREGEPFAALIDKKGFVPNRGAAYCSTELKTRVTRDFAKSFMGWKKWTSVIGLRYDEGLRVMKTLARNDSGKDPWKSIMPMAKAKHTKADVMRFWFGPTYRHGELPRFLEMDQRFLPQGFDLGLLDEHGNCDGCFKKALSKRERIIRADPSMADWWIAQEEKPDRRGADGSLFDERISFSELRQRALNSPDMFAIDDPNEEFDAECGLVCGDDE